MGCSDSLPQAQWQRQLAPSREPNPDVGYHQVEAVGCILVHFLFWQLLMMQHVASKIFHWNIPIPSLELIILFVFPTVLIRKAVSGSVKISCLFMWSLTSLCHGCKSLNLFKTKNNWPLCMQTWFSRKLFVCCAKSVFLILLEYSESSELY